mgnify:CR=1 FL=1
MPADPVKILREARTVAVLGMKGDDQPDAPASRIPQYLRANGYEITPVNPSLARQGYPGAVATLAEVSPPPDVVQVFRSGDALPRHLDELRALRPGAVWLQPGAENAEVARQLEEAGIPVVQGECMYALHRRLLA